MAQLTRLQVRTWQRLQSRLAPGGRIYANLGCFERSGVALTCLAEVFGMGEPVTIHGNTSVFGILHVLCPQSRAVTPVNLHD